MSIKISNGLNLQNQRIINLGDGSNPTDAVTLQQLLNYVNGLSFKDEVRVATTANGALATAFASGQTVDGVVLATGNRILVKNQTASAENGIYVVAASGAPTRATDADTTAKLDQATVRVKLGTTNGNTQWTQSADVTTVGTTAQTWAPSGSGGTSYTQGTGIVISAGVISVDPAVVTRKWAATIGNGALTTIPCVHNLGTRDVDVTVYDAATYEEVLCDNVRTDANTVNLIFGVAPASSSLRVVING